LVAGDLRRVLDVAVEVIAVPNPHRLGTEEADRLRRIRDADPALDRLTIHVRGWATMMTELQGQDLERWIVVVEQDTLAPLASFARNLRRDQDAVHAGLTLQHSPDGSKAPSTRSRC
jgi:hypothetical protein